MELPSPKIEALPSPETSREGVMRVVNDVASSWRMKINRSHREINPFVELDDLANTPLNEHQSALFAQSRDEFGAYRRYEKDVRALTGQGDLGLFNGQPRDTITRRFRNLETGEFEERDEGLDVSDLIGHLDSEIGKVRAEIESQRSFIEPSDWYIQYQQKRISGFERQRATLVANSEPYPEVIPHALDDNDMVERSRIATEAARVWKEPLNATGFAGSDKSVAVARLRKAMLLKLPPKSVEVKTEAPSPIIATSKVDEYGEIVGLPTGSEPKAPPIVVDGIAQEKGSGKKGKTPGGSPFGDPNLRLAAGELEKLWHGDEKVFPDGETLRRVGRLLKVKLPDFDRRRLLLVPLILLLPLVLSRSTNPNIPPIARGMEPTPSAPPINLDVPVPPIPFVPKLPELPLPVGIPTPPTEHSKVPVEESTPRFSPDTQPTKPATPEDPGTEVEIKAGETVRGIIADALKASDPTASPIDIDEAASVVLWKVLKENPQISVEKDPNLVQPGDKFKIPTTLREFMTEFKKMEVEKRQQLIKQMNAIADTPDAKSAAENIALDTYSSLIGNLGSQKP